MAEWLDSKLFRGWFWKEMWGNFMEWCADAPVFVVVSIGSTALLFGWLLVVGYFPKPTPVVRGSGVFLQLFGFILAAYGLEQTLEKFGQKPSTSRILPWLSCFWDVFDTSRTASLSVTGAAEAIAGDLSVNISQGISPPKSKAERIRILERKVGELREELGEIRDEKNEDIERLESKIEEEVEAVKQDVQEMRKKVKEVNVGKGALWLEWWGVSLFVYGVPLASFPTLFLPAYRVLAIPLLAGGLLGSLHWFAN